MNDPCLGGPPGSSTDEFAGGGVSAPFDHEADARDHLAAIVESAEDAIISKDVAGLVRSWNPAAEKIFGYAAREMVGHPIMRLVPAERVAEEDAILERLRAGERIQGFWTERLRKDGTRVAVSLTISPVRDRAGRIVGASKIARDVSSQVEHEREQKSLIDQLQVALAEIKTLRGLLPICMHCKMIRDDRGSWQPVHEYLRARSSVRFSHGICPRCLERHYSRP